MQGIALLRTGNYVLKNGVGFFLVSIFVTSESVAQRHILYLEDETNPQKVGSKSSRYL